jgi:hypothetical protein
LTDSILHVFGLTAAMADVARTKREMIWSILGNGIEKIKKERGGYFVGVPIAY